MKKLLKIVIWTLGTIVLLFIVAVLLTPVDKNNINNTSGSVKENENRESKLLAAVKQIPVSEYRKNLDIYEELVSLNPNNKKYQDKVKFYEQQIENIDHATARQNRKGKKTRHYTETLPPHKYIRTSRIGKSRSQIRAVIEPGAYTEQEIRQISLRLAKANWFIGGAYLVQFFDDNSCLQGWDGSGLLRESDWPHWLCRVTINTEKDGEFYAATFKLAVDGISGLERTDVLRK